MEGGEKSVALFDVIGKKQEGNFDAIHFMCERETLEGLGSRMCFKVSHQKLYLTQLSCTTNGEVDCAGYPGHYQCKRS